MFGLYRFSCAATEPTQVLALYSARHAVLEIVTIVMHTHLVALAGGVFMRDLAKEPEVARQALETMWTARRFEEAVDQLFARGLMHGTMHLSIGQEASATGHLPRAATG